MLISLFPKCLHLAPCLMWQITEMTFIVTYYFAAGVCSSTGFGKGEGQAGGEITQRERRRPRGGKASQGERKDEG